MKVLSHILDTIENISSFLVKILIIGLTVIVILNVIMRNLGTPIIWSTEFSEYTLLYITFLGAAFLLKHDGHVTVDILDTILSERLKKVLDVLVYFLGLGISVLLLSFGAIVTFDAWESNLKSLTVLQVPLAYVYAIIPIGCFLLSLEFTRKIFRSFINFHSAER